MLYTTLQEYAQLIAAALTAQTGESWERSTRFDADDTNWRAELEGPKGAVLFVSNTWSGKGRLYIGSTFPQGSSNFQPTERPSITVSDEKSAQQIAKDIVRRLLPAYLPQLAIVLKRLAEANDFEARRAALAEEVAEVVGGRVQGEMVYGGGWDLQVSSANSIRLQGHCNYLTLDQLKKIVSVCPELFRTKEN